MTLTDFQAAKLREWAEHCMTIGYESDNMPRGIAEVNDWAFWTIDGRDFPFPTFDTVTPYTWEG